MSAGAREITDCISGVMFVHKPNHNARTRRLVNSGRGNQNLCQGHHEDTIKKRYGPLL